MKLELLHKVYWRTASGEFHCEAVFVSFVSPERIEGVSDALRDKTDHASHAGLATDVEAVRLKTIYQV